MKTLQDLLKEIEEEKSGLNNATEQLRWDELDKRKFMIEFELAKNNQKYES